MTDDLQKIMDDIFDKKVKSYLSIVPSQHLTEEQYGVFLEIASPEELEQDIITRKTLNEIAPPDYSKWTVMK